MRRKREQERKDRDEKESGKKRERGIKKANQTNGCILYTPQEIKKPTRFVCRPVEV